MPRIFTLFFLGLFLLPILAFSASSPWMENQSKGAKVKILSSFYEENGSKKLIAALEFEIRDGWKIYGNDDSGLGLPPNVDFTGSSNFQRHKIIWPQAEIFAEKIGDNSLKYHAYKHRVILPIELEIEDANKPTKLLANLDYGLCSDVCIPAHEEFSLEVLPEIDQEILAKIAEFYPKFSAEKSAAASSPTPLKISLISVIFIALLGGAILNIMPCVLPVLSIKLLSIINHANTDIARIRTAFTATIFGTLSCFITFAALAAILKFTGNSLGWGLQFQNPFFLVFLIIILMILIANLLGLFEVTFSEFLVNFLNKKITIGENKQHIIIPNFLSGILAVLLATPCSAPFLGSAISFGLTQNFLTILLIFLAIGIGFASPYLVLLSAPRLVYLLPKPGNWMNRFKQILAGLLAATIIWLAYVLSSSVGFVFSILSILLAALLLGCFKIKTPSLKIATFILTIIATLYIPSSIHKIHHARESRLNAMWHKFDEAEIKQKVAQGKVVVIDITADWCITCKFNKIRVLRDKEIMAKLGEPSIFAMRGDITKSDSLILDYLHKNNRFAIPFNAVYGPKAPNGIILSEFLTKDELQAAIKKAQ